MPRYYFDVHNGENILRDDDGTEFDSLDAAVRGGRHARRRRLE